MNRWDRHMSAEELLQFSDGELSLFRKVLARRHLAGCWECRTKLRDSEDVIGEIVRLHHRTLDPQLPQPAGSRALLKARLQQVGPLDGRSGFMSISAWSRVAAVGIFFALLVGVFLTGQRRTRAKAANSRLAISSLVKPNRQLTPGATRFVSTEELCATEVSDDASDASPEVKDRVLKRYGLSGQLPTTYQLDYLISPQLGGTEDASNLWPEPAAATTWNVKTKDALEDRLRQMVCRGNLSLADAQRDLAIDWVSAYKKYFHTTHPVQPL